MNYSQKRESLWRLVEGVSLVRAVGAYDAITARLIEESAFEAIWAGSMGICTALGYPDADIVTMSEFLDAARVLNRSTNIPVIADCNSGYGSIHNVIRMVKEYENAGIAAICIEDQVFPKKNSFYSGTNDLEETNLFCEKLSAAVQAREDSKFMIIARIEALVAGRDVTEALDRAYAYKLAGTDMIAIHSKSKTPDEIIRFLESWASKTPVMVIPTTYYLSIEQLKALKVSIVVYANQALRAIVPSVKQLLTQISDHPGDINIPSHRIADLDEIFQLHQLNSWNYFSRDQTTKK